MPRCEDYIEHISAAIDGELSPQETARLEEHLAYCPACQALMGDLAALHAQLGALPPVEVPKNLKEDILAAVHDSKVTPLPTKKNFYYKKWMASAAALALVMAGAWGWSVSRPGSPSPLPLAGNLEAAAPQETPVSAKAADSAASGSISTPAPVVTAAPALDGVPTPASLPAPESADVSESAMDGAAQVPAQGRAKASESSQAAQPVPQAAEPAPQAAEPAPQNDAVPQMAVQPRMAAPPAGAGLEEAGETVPTASPQLFCALPPADSGVGMEPDNSLEPQPTPEPVPNAFVLTTAPVESQEPLTPRQGLEQLIEELGFTGYEWIEDGENVSTRPEFSRTPALLWMNGTEGISYINYLGLSEAEDYHLYQFDHLTWDIVEFNSCPTGQVTHLNRYAVPLNGGDILDESDPEFPELGSE